MSAALESCKMARSFYTGGIDKNKPQLRAHMVQTLEKDQIFSSAWQFIKMLKPKGASVDAIAKVRNDTPKEVEPKDIEKSTEWDVI